MTRGQGRSRLLLVLMLAVGVLSMHALGHMSGGGMGMMPSATSAMHATAHAGGHAPAQAARSGSAARCRLADPGPMSVCLGLAGGAGLLVGCVLLRRARTFCCRVRAVAALGSGGAPLGSRAGRSPPGRGGFAVSRVAWA